MLNQGAWLTERKVKACKPWPRGLKKLLKTEEAGKRSHLFKVEGGGLSGCVRSALACQTAHCTGNGLSQRGG
jgi:hypothetical protein